MSAETAVKGAEWLRRALRLPDNQSPFPWQLELLQRFLRGEATDALDIPTGLGKTAVMAVWLVARALGANVPRRLVYVVDRRAVVDQATEVAEALCEWVQREQEIADALGLEGRPLAISTLRGAHVDNKAWLEDPSAEAIIVGTIDMIGSRLLFSGYGVSPRMRPYHAGLLGVDSLVVLDEAHLVPAFEDLLADIANGASVFGAQARLLDHVPRFALLSLSATARARKRNALTLGAADLAHPVVRERLDASKTLSTLTLGATEKLPQKLAEIAWAQSGEGCAPVRCLVFCDSRNDAVRVVEALKSLAESSGAPTPTVELFVGARRVRERSFARDALAALGFLAGSTVALERATFLVATSAGEVGVDLDADHMVCDLVSWDRMVQRFGRVNRRGKGRSSLVVVLAKEPKRLEAVEKAMAKRAVAVSAEADGPAKDIAGEKARKKRIRAYKDNDAKLVHEHERMVEHRRALVALLEAVDEQHGDVSPGALVELHQRADMREHLARATTREPLRPALTRAHVDAWSMTSLENHPGRSDVEPWLRGWRPNDAPQTSIVWRRHLPVRPHERFDARGAQRFFEAAPPHASELLEVEARAAAAWLIACAARLRRSAGSEPVVSSLGALSAVAIVLSGRGDVKAAWDLETLDAPSGSKISEQVEAALGGATLVVDGRLGGLSMGLLDQSVRVPAEAADDGVSAWLTRSLNGANVPVTGFRVARVGAGDGACSPNDGCSLVDPADAWVRRAVFVLHSGDEGPTSVLAVDGWEGESALEDDRAAANVPQSLEEHQAWVEASAQRIAARVGLSGELAKVVTVAGRLHDEGKRPACWQRAFNAPDDGIAYAKTRGPIDFVLLDGYRHELGSLPYAQADAQLRAMSPELQELVLHLIAAHHGFARPVIGTNGCDDAPPSLIEARAAQVMHRFMRLQQRWGPWGLAWWESLVRAADQEASRRNQQRERARVPSKEASSWR